MSDLPNCPKCNSEYTYEDRDNLVCPMCDHQWSLSAPETDGESSTRVIKDANGNPLQDGDAVVVVKDLKIKGSSNVVKGGTKVKSIRLVEGEDGHDIDCKIPGFGSMQLKSEYVKKAK